MTRTPILCIVLIVLCTAHATAGTQTTFFNVADFGAKGDGIQNDTTPIQLAINALATSPVGTVYIPTGTYMVRADSFGIRLRSNMTLELAPGATLKALTSTKSYAVVRVDSLHDVIIRGGTIDGNRPHPGAVTDTCVGVIIRGSRNVRVDGVRVRNMPTSGFRVASYVSGATSRPDSTIHFTQCIAENDSVAGFDVRNAVGGSIVDCDALPGMIYGYRLAVGSGSTESVTEWTIDGCRATQDSFGIALIGTGACEPPSAEPTAYVTAAAPPTVNVISRNTVRGALARGIYLQSDASRNILTGNEVSQSRGAGILLKCQCRHNTVVSNLLTGNCTVTTLDSAQLVLRSNCDSNNVQANTCRRWTGLSFYGVQIFNSTCDSNLVTNNDLLGSGSTRGLQDLGTATRKTAGNSTMVQHLSATPSSASGRIVRVTWDNASPPEDFVGYMLEKSERDAAWGACSPLLRTETAWTDSFATPLVRYRLLALTEREGREVVGEVEARLARPVMVWPSVQREAPVTIAYAAVPGLDGRDPEMHVGVYDARGRLVRELANGAAQVGTHAVEWDGQTATGVLAARGIYTVRVSSSTGEAATTRVVVWR